MTSTPVKDVSSLLNFVGNQGAAASGIKAGGSGDFGSVMSRASYQDENSSSQKQLKSDKDTGLSENRVSQSTRQSSKRKEVLNADRGESTVRTEEVTDGKEQAVSEAGSEMLKEIAEELGVGEEEVVDAMEELGFGMTALLDADNLTKLILVLSGEENPLALLTDESLYGKVQNLLQSLDEISRGLMEEFSMGPEELEQVLATVNAEEISENEAAESGFELPVPETGKEQELEQQQPKITVTVEEGTQSVKLTADENGNAVSVEEVTPKEESKDQGSSKGRDNPENSKSEQEFERTNFSVESLFKTQTQNTEAVFEQLQTAAETANSSQEIMDQILDYMKIQLKPEMDQLEMQLHPESLGTLRVQITAKSGEVTAQFQVQNESVKAAIENQIGVLKDTLREQGVKVEAVEVTVESHAFESNLWQGKEREDGSSYQGNRKSPRRINLNALDESFEKEADEGDLLAAEMMKANGGTVDYTA